MGDEEFRHPRLAAIYDALQADRSDLQLYVRIAEELGARRVLDLGCGTGTLAILLAARGLDVVAVEPAAASLEVARRKPGAARVRWIDGDATTLQVAGCDLATITGNTVQAIADPQDWQATLRGIHAALRPGGFLVFETRDPAARAWEGWNRRATYRTIALRGGGTVTTWVELTRVDLPLISFRWTWCFADDGATLTSDSTLRFRARDELESDLRANGYTVLDVRDAPDRPGRELVFVTTACEPRSPHGPRSSRAGTG